MILERLDRLERHRLHDVAPDQLLDVQDISVGEVLRRSTPRHPYERAPLERRKSHRSPATPPSIAHRRASRSRPQLALESVRPTSSSRPSAAISTRDTKKLATDSRWKDHRRRDKALYPRRYASATAAYRCCEKISVTLMDGPRRSSPRSRRGRARYRRPAIEVRVVDLLVEAVAWANSASRSFAIRVDLHRHVPVDPSSTIHTSRSRSQASRIVLQRERRRTARPGRRSPSSPCELLVVPVPLGGRLSEDRRVEVDDRQQRRRPSDEQLARLEHLARERVDPDAHAVRAGSCNLDVAISTFVLCFSRRRPFGSSTISNRAR